MSQKQIDRLTIVEDELWETRDWRATRDVAKARRRLGALSAKEDLIVEQASHGGGDGEEIRQNLRVLRERIAALEAWITSQDTTRSGFRLRGMTRMRHRYQGVPHAGNEEAHQS